MKHFFSSISLICFSIFNIFGQQHFSPYPITPQPLQQPIVIFASPTDGTSLTQHESCTFTIPQTSLSFIIDQPLKKAVQKGADKYPVLSFAYPEISTGRLSEL